MKKYIIGIIIGIGILSGVYVLANPIFFPGYATTGNATATTTLQYMTPGTATSSVTYDAYQISQSDSAKGTNPTGALSLSLLVQLTATTGVPTLNINCESSRDGIDWYKSDCYDISTTTNIANVSGEMSSYTWVFASSTCGIGGAKLNAAESICERHFDLEAKTRFTRVVFTLASTTGASATPKDDGGVYAELGPIKEMK